MDEDAYIFF